MNTTFVGLDLSYSGTGIVVQTGDKIECAEFAAGTPQESFPVRADKLVDLILPMIPANAKIYMEGPAYAANFQAFHLGQLAGVIEYMLTNAGHSYTLVQPSALKKFATGAGNAPKALVAAHVAKKWDFIHKSDNIVDAFVLCKMAADGAVDGVVKKKPAKRKSKVG